MLPLTLGAILRIKAHDHLRISGFTTSRVSDQDKEKTTYSNKNKQNVKIALYGQTETKCYTKGAKFTKIKRFSLSLISPQGGALRGLNLKKRGNFAQFRGANAGNVIKLF